METNKAVTEGKEATKDDVETKQGEKKRVPLVNLSNGTGDNNKPSGEYVMIKNLLVSMLS